MRTSRLLTATAVMGAALFLGGCFQISDLGGGPEAVRDADTGEITDAGKADVFTLSVGDCMNNTSSEEVTDVPVVPCSDPHDTEVYYEFSLPDGEYPGKDEVYSAAEEGCYNEFANFVGIAYEESTLEFSYFAPTQQSWDQGNDRLVSCLVVDTAEQVTGTLAGAAR
ncbi:septum formation family protein [Microbacterium sp. Clip185]|uniref:septum formation family protein n=1 Tax=Microbacterium sp. Clip185 TaxID=3025663 RepID=UPI0023665A8F|nr:septum formation family protein [Microbacterium sp. Clip185]WDG17995.1 septum formation family protein [Microbacterium sp. Clip185]